MCNVLYKHASDMKIVNIASLQLSTYTQDSKLLTKVKQKR